MLMQSAIRRTARAVASSRAVATRGPLRAAMSASFASTSHPVLAAAQTASRSVSGRRSFSTDAPSSAMDENRFLEIAEDTLEEIQVWLDGIEEMLDESDISLAQGVLKIDLGEHGTWVLNRQIPNRQIWWSSPISGPRRYEFDAETGTWINTRDRTELFERLQAEICDATGISIHQ